MNQASYLQLLKYLNFSKRVVESDKFEWYEKGTILFGIFQTVELLCGVEVNRDLQTKEKIIQWFENFQIMMDKLASVAPFPE